MNAIIENFKKTDTQIEALKVKAQVKTYIEKENDIVLSERETSRASQMQLAKLSGVSDKVAFNLYATKKVKEQLEELKK